MMLAGKRSPAFSLTRFAAAVAQANSAFCTVGHVHVSAALDGFDDLSHGAPGDTPAIFDVAQSWEDAATGDAQDDGQSH